MPVGSTANQPENRPIFAANLPPHSATASRNAPGTAAASCGQKKRLGKNLVHFQAVWL